MHFQHVGHATPATPAAATAAPSTPRRRKSRGRSPGPNQDQAVTVPAAVCLQLRETSCFDSLPAFGQTIPYVLPVLPVQHAVFKSILKKDISRKKRAELKLKAVLHPTYTLREFLLPRNAELRPYDYHGSRKSPPVKATMLAGKVKDLRKALYLAKLLYMQCYTKTEQEAQQWKPYWFFNAAVTGNLHGYQHDLIGLAPTGVQRKWIFG